MDRRRLKGGKTGLVKLNSQWQGAMRIWYGASAGFKDRHGASAFLIFRYRLRLGGEPPAS